jgi:uncharacterized membrane protein YeaQ/YmgE (transglycosylase-associated protein family)
MGDAIAFSVVGAVIALAVFALFWRGVSFGINPPVRFERKTDPFGFWLNILIPGVVAALLLFFGLSQLYSQAIC